MMKNIRNIWIVLSLMLFLGGSSCSSGGAGAGESRPEFFGARIGDDSTTVVGAFLKNKIVRLDSVSSSPDWMNFMKRPEGYIVASDELWEMVSVHFVSGRADAIRFVNSYPTLQLAKKEYQSAARRLSRYYPLHTADMDDANGEFVIMRCFAMLESGGLNFALTNGKSLTGRRIYNIVLEFY